jgi:hypothetical protein
MRVMRMALVVLTALREPGLEKLLLMHQIFRTDNKSTPHKVN